MPTITPTVYSFRDVPAYENKILLDLVNVKDIFKGILVNGFGGKPALGWTIQFEDASGIVFRNPSDTMSVSFRNHTSGSFTQYNIADDFTDSTTYTTLFYGGCLRYGDTQGFAVVGYGDTFNFIASKFTDSTYFTTDYHESHLVNFICVGKYNSFHNSVNPYYCFGGYSRRVDKGSGNWTSEPYSQGGYQLHSIIKIDQALNQDLPDSVEGGMTIPFNHDGSIKPYSRYSRLYNGGLKQVINGTGVVASLSTIESRNIWLDCVIYDFIDLEYSINYTLNQGIKGVIPSLMLGGNINQDATTNRFGDIITVNGRDYLYLKTYDTPIWLRVDSWEEN
jgi:hypothetical protein